MTRRVPSYLLLALLSASCAPPGGSVEELIEEADAGLGAKALVQPSQSYGASEDTSLAAAATFTVKSTFATTSKTF